MDRNTDLQNMAAPGVGSGKSADSTILVGQASKTSSEKEGNDLTEYVTPKMSMGALGGVVKK